MMTVSAIATAIALGSTTTTTTNAFTIGTSPMQRTTLTTSLRNASPIAVATTSTTTFLKMSTTESTTDSEVQRLKAMAAKLRQEAAELELEQANERVRAVEIAFDKFDTNQNGELSLDELKAALEKTFSLELSQERVERLMQDFDTSGDGKLQREEMVSLNAFRNRLESLATEERQKALDATKAAQQEEEMTKLIETQMELINDKEPSGTDKIVSVLPYLFPLMDGLVFGQHLLAGNEDNPIVAALALLFVAYRSIPFSGFLAFFALNTFSNNLSINRLVRFNMQQAVFLDIALFVPGLLATLATLASQGVNLNVPPMVGEFGGDAVFLTLVAMLSYSTVTSLLGQTPDKIPFLSQAVKDRVPTADQIELFDYTTGQPIMKKKKDETDDNNDNNKKD